MKRDDLIALVDRQYAALPDFLKREPHIGRGHFQLMQSVFEDMGKAKGAEANEIVGRHAAQLFGIEFEPLRSEPETQNAKPIAEQASESFNEAALIERLIQEVSAPFGGTSDGSAEDANYKAGIARQRLETFLDEHACRTNPLRHTLRKRGEQQIEEERMFLIS